MSDGRQFSGHVPPSKATALLPREGRREGKEVENRREERKDGEEKEREERKGGLAIRKDTRSWLLSVLSGRIFLPDYQGGAHRPRCSPP